MPLVNGDMCPIAIDVVAPPQPAKPTDLEDVPEDLLLKPSEQKKVPEEEIEDEGGVVDEHETIIDADEEEYLRDHAVMHKDEHFEDEEHIRYVDEGAYGGGDEDEEFFDLEEERFIPEKHEHSLDDEEEDENLPRQAPRKSEHHLDEFHSLPADVWRPTLHSIDA